jgi:hypothetical protein
MEYLIEIVLREGKCHADELRHRRDLVIALHAEYVAELQRLWDDLDHYDPLDLPHADCISTVKKWIERRRVIQFPKGLNSEFEGRRLCSISLLFLLWRRL